MLPVWFPPAYQATIDDIIPLGSPSFSGASKFALASSPEPVPPNCLVNQKESAAWAQTLRHLILFFKAKELCITLTTNVQ